jgi:hypothetical protein
MIDSLASLNGTDEAVKNNLDSLLDIEQRKRLPSALQKFISTYKYKDVQSLFCLYHFNIRDNDSCRCLDDSPYYKDTILRKTRWFENILD